MSRFSDTDIEGLIAVAKDLRLSRLRVAESDSELSIELPRADRVLVPTEPSAAPASSERDVTSQYVGYFRPSIDVGVTISKDMVVGVVESLGLPNDVLAPATGRVTEFLISDGDAVEFGTVVARIEL